MHPLGPAVSLWHGWHGLQRFYFEVQGGAMETAFMWNDQLTTGLSDVDEQHQTIMRLFNELHWAFFLQESERDSTQADVYGRLLAYTEFHFQEEEEKMLRFGLDIRHYQAHAQAHAKFLTQLSALWAQRATMKDPDATLAGFLSAWLGLHILGFDHAMARQIRAIQEGQAPHEAFEQVGQNPDQGMHELLGMMGSMYSVLSAHNVRLVAENQSLQERLAVHAHELASAQLRVKSLGRTDALLGIANRGYFHERLEQACALGLRGERPVGVLLIDLDRFKSYNDTYGQLQGDECLRAVAAALQTCLHRSTDLLARYGGEELAVLLPDTNQEGAQEVAQRMLLAVRGLQLPHENSTVGPFVTVSIGVSAHVPYPKTQVGGGAAALMAAAEEALCRAKTQGRNRWAA